jgi:tape measure domain-containing protein
MQKKFQFIISANAAGFSSAMGKASGGLKAFNKNMAATDEGLGVLGKKMTSMVGRFSALFGGISATLFTKSIWEAGTAMQSLQQTFTSITGSSQLAGQEIDFVRQVSNELGIEFQTTIGAYKNLAAAAKGTQIEGKTTREIFLGISEAATVLGLRADETEGALLAISQMISKGKVSAEELRGQLGERLPGAFQIAADSMGVTTAELDKMLSSGEIMAEDFLPKFAEALRKHFSEDAKKHSDSAIAAFNRLSNAWFDLRAGIAESGFLDLVTGKLNNLAAALNDPKVRAQIIELSNRFFELAEAVLTFAVNHGEAIAKTAGAVIALGFLARAVSTVTTIWNAMNAAMVAMTGLRLVSWFGELRAATLAASASTTLMATSLKALGAAGLVFWSGSKVIEAVQAYGEMREAQKMAAESAKNAEAAEARYQDRLKRASEAAGVVLTSWRDVQQAYKDGLIDYDKETDTYTKGSGQRRESYEQVAEAAKESAGKQREVTAEALEDMRQQYNQYVLDIKRLQEEISGREKSLAEELRAMGRSGMDDLSAWKDLKREAQEYESAAVKAADAGNFEQAVELADKAKEKYKQLNTEVKDGDKVLISQAEALKTAMSGVHSAGKLAIDALESQKKAAEDAAKALDLEADGKLSKSVEGVNEGVLKITDSAIDMGDTLVEQINKFGVAAAREFDKAEQWLRQPHEMTIERKFVDKHATGGMVGYARGGKLPGYGGGDRVRALLEAGEFVIRKEAVRKYGLGLFHALNSMNLTNLNTIRARLGGMIHAAAHQPIRLQTGGMVGAAAATGNTYNLSVTFSDSSGIGSTSAGRKHAAQLMRELRRFTRRSS